MQGAAREEAGEASNENDRKPLFFHFRSFSASRPGHPTRHFIFVRSRP